MVADDALPPAIRRSPEAAFKQQKRQYTALDYDYDDSDESPDEATPPPISRSRSNSTDVEQQIRRNLDVSPGSTIKPLNITSKEPKPPIPPRHKFHYPNRSKSENIQALEAPEAPPSNSRRSSRGLVSYRANKRIPLHLQRQPSLETIASVTTTASDDYCDPPEAEAPPPDWFSQEEDPSTTPIPSTRAPSTYASSTTSNRSSTPGATPLETPLEFTSLGRHSPQSLFRKMMPKKIEDSTLSPNRLIIARTTSIDRTTNPSTLSKSTTSLPSTRSNLSLPPASVPSECSPESGLISVGRSQSGSSSEWSASSFDIGSLTDAELKRCKKKGINPSLYAEMKAAKGKKWTSPIAGNTFL